MIRYFVINLIPTLTTLALLFFFKKNDLNKHPTARLRSRQVQQVWKNLTQKKGSTWEDFGKEEFQNIETDGEACWLDDLHKVKMYNKEGRKGKEEKAEKEEEGKRRR